MALDHATAAARETLRVLIYGYAQTQLLRIAARLRLADLLAAQPLTAGELADMAPADAAILQRLLHGLAASGVVAECEGRYHLTEIGQGLREDVPGSLASFAILSGEEYYRSWLGLDVTAANAKTPFETAYGEPFFTWLETHPEVSDRFHGRMATRIASYAAAAADVVDLTEARRIVDIGGGRGALLAAFLRRWPRARGVLFDLPEATADGGALLAETELADRVEIAGGDFFRDAVPAGGDVYLLSQILHDWDDARGERILANIRSTMRPDGRLLVIEALLPERVTGPHPAIDLDLVMLVLTGGQERSVAAFRALLEGAGFALDRVHEGIAPGGMALLEARPG